MNKDRQKTVGKYWNQETSLKRMKGWKNSTLKEIVEELKTSHPFIQIKTEMEILANFVIDEQKQKFVEERSETVRELVLEYVDDVCTFKKLQMVGKSAIDSLTDVLNDLDGWDVKPYVNIDKARLIKVDAGTDKPTELIRSNEENVYEEKEFSF